MSTPIIKIETVQGKAIPLRGNDIDTDRIIPARYLRCVTFDGLGEHAFEDDRAQNPDHVFDKSQYQEASILLSGKNFGCGSSREHAPQSLSKWGIRGIVGESFAEIFYGNCIAIGIPCFRIQPDELQALYAAVEADPNLVVKLNVAEGTVSYGDTTLQADLPEGVRNAFIRGTWNATMTLLQAEEKIDQTAKRLPYVSGW